MADYPGYGNPPPFLHTWTRFSGCWELAATATSLVPASASWATSNAVRYVPMSLPWAYHVMRVFWVNGSVASGTADFGIYTPSGERLYSTGSTAKSGTSAPQYTTPGTPLWLYPGDYYFALTMSGTTNACFGNTIAAAQQRFAGIKQQLSTSTLPAAATFATPSIAGVGLCGVTWTTSGG